MPTQRPPTPVEQPTTLRLNGETLLRVQTTPVHLDDWAIGLLFTEGIIAGPAAVADLRVSPADAAGGTTVEVTAAAAPTWDPAMAGRRYLTSGCGKGVTFSSLRDALSLQPLRHRTRVDHARLAACQAELEAGAVLYRASGGSHAAGVANLAGGQVVVREDIGRHHAVDKVLGAVLRLGWAPADLILVTTGRISYEMCAKLARVGVAVGASRTAVTDQAVRLAQRLQMTLAGYLRPNRITVYTDGPGRLRAPVS